MLCSMVLVLALMKLYSPIGVEAYTGPSTKAKGYELGDSTIAFEYFMDAS